jgi:TonB family protein
MNQDGTLADFDRAIEKGGARKSSRAIGAALTGCLYALLALIALLPPPLPPDTMILSETTVRLLPDTPHKTTPRPPPPFLAPLIRPHAESASPPDFTVAPAAIPLRAPLPAFAPVSSSLAGGITASLGASAGSANGKNGNGEAASGCFDAVWAQAVTNHVGRFYRYPRSANGATGIVMMDFTVRRSGRLDMLQVGKTSGSDSLDRVAYEMVRHAVPLPRIPERMHAERVTVELPIGFGADVANLQPSPGTCE